MRLTLPRLSHLSTTALETYLTSLKATQLKLLARSTGIPNSGRKDELRQRIHEELLTSIFLRDADDNNHDSSEHKRKKKKREKVGKELSILSIDMGIQNLAFAHLLVHSPPGEHAPEKCGDGLDKGLIELNAWHRIGVQELGASAVPTQAAADTEVNLQSLLPASAFRTFASTTRSRTKPSEGLSEANDEIEEDPPIKTAVAANKNFEPETLSRNAFVLLSSLLQAYKPTHILIERQRFRSAGQSAVLEWSLRVGVFEGMLHAVLCTMRELSRQILHGSHGGGGSHGLSGVVDGLKVYSISPARVMQFWDEGKSDSTQKDDEEEEDGRKGKGQNQRGVKKFKMDIVGDLLLFASTKNSSKTGESLSCWDIAVKTDKDEQSFPGISDVVDAYLRRWNPQVTDSKSVTPKGNKKSKSAIDHDRKAYKIDKMDDLADCLLQGVTWLEWQARRARIVRGNRF